MATDLTGRALYELFDVLFENDQAAADFLHVSLLFFQQNYKTYCGLKQGQSKTYTKSELLRRRAQLARELAGSHAADA